MKSNEKHRFARSASRDRRSGAPFCALTAERSGFRRSTGMGHRRSFRPRSSIGTATRRQASVHFPRWPAFLSGRSARRRWTEVGARKA